MQNGNCFVTLTDVDLVDAMGGGCADGWLAGNQYGRDTLGHNPAGAAFGAVLGAVGCGGEAIAPSSVNTRLADRIRRSGGYLHR